MWGGKDSGLERKGTVGRNHKGDKGHSGARKKGRQEKLEAERLKLFSQKAKKGGRGGDLIKGGGKRGYTKRLKCKEI